jgi:hypothetical protein
VPTPAAEPTPAGKKVEVDWARIIWRLQAEYPGNRRFDDANFGNCPLLLVESALESIADRSCNATAPWHCRSP